ncbi:hypothetical protein ACFL6P_10240, partial [Candidatus Latescibacterota bacterium]
MGFLFSRLHDRFKRSINQNRSTEPETIGQRRANAIKRWTYYHGTDPVSGDSQWSYLYRRFETMPKRDMEDIENHTRICTDRLRRLLVNSWRGFEFDDEETGKNVMDVFRKNRWPHLLNLIGLYGKVTGDAFIKITPAPPESRFGPLRLILLDSESVELEVSPHDRDDVHSVSVMYDYFDRDELKPGSFIRKSYKEIIDSRSVTGFINGEYAPEYSSDHDLGFIPVVHVRN